jgi:outer membrane lipopolysaccharide assembly protein LptE/RlpB
MKGLDMMYDDVIKGRSNIALAINNLNLINTDNANTMIVQLLTQAKSNEIASIFEMSDKAEKESVLKMMTKIDATNTQKYQNALQKNK